MEVGHIRQRRLSDNIVEQLETMILEGTLQPGERLPPERALAEQFGVSRPSLREAVQKLVAKGLLISRQGGGNYVSETLGSSFSDRQHLQTAFDELQRCYAKEGKATRAEEGAADARFHLAIAEASHNMVLLHTIRGLFDLLKRNVVTNIGGMYALRSETRLMLVEQHQALFAAIMQGRAEDARKIASEHISYVQDVLAQSQEENRRMARAQRRERSPTR